MSGPGQCIYDYPLYYDVLFGWDRDAEAGFYDAALRTYGVEAGGRLLEVGCGTGQIALRMAMLGWRVTGLDVRGAMLEFLDGSARARGLSVKTVHGDLSGFRLAETQDGAICPVGTFGILANDRAALGHLRAMADALRPGGVYVIDLGLACTGCAAEAMAEERREWSIRRDGVSARATGGKVLLEDSERGVRLTLGWGRELRRLSGDGFARLLARSEAFDVVAWHPEARCDEDGVSVFDLNCAESTPPTGRVMVALRRC